MLIELNKQIVEHLSRTELGVVQFINENEKKLAAMSIVDIAFETYTSPATVSRAIRKCNIHGFSELRSRGLKPEQRPGLGLANEIMNQSLNEVQNIIDSISATQIMQAIELVESAEKICVLGRGLSEYVAEEFSMKLQLMNKDSIFIKDPNIMRLKSRQMDSRSLAVIFSLNGHTAELLESAENMKFCGGRVLVCCCNPSSGLVPLSDLALIGYSEPHSSITEYEVRSRLPLYVISRMITEYFAGHRQEAE